MMSNKEIIVPCLRERCGKPLSLRRKIGTVCEECKFISCLGKEPPKDRDPVQVYSSSFGPEMYYISYSPIDKVDIERMRIKSPMKADRLERFIRNPQSLDSKDKNQLYNGIILKAQDNINLKESELKIVKYMIVSDLNKFDKRRTNKWGREVFREREPGPP